MAPEPEPDIAADESGMVRPETGGMSVVPNWRDLRFYRIPRRLKIKVPGAKGSDQLFCWRLGEGPFVAGPIAPRLSLRPDDDVHSKHGVIEPTQVMALTEYQEALAATRDQWVIDED